MQKIMVANPKGGAGKSTLAVNLACWYARQGDTVCLADLDRQQSARGWLARRPRSLPAIKAWKTEEGELLEAPADCRYAVLDTPAGLHGKALKQLLSSVDRVIVPVLPSRFDMLASEHFFEALMETKAVRKEKVSVAMVGMRVEPRTRASQELMRFLAEFELPLVTCLRNTQRYVQALELGAGIFDATEASSRQDREQWQPLLDWLRTSRTR